MHKGLANNRKANGFYSISWGWSYKGGSLTQTRHNSSQYNNKKLRDSAQTKAPTPPLHNSDSLQYTNEGHNEMVELVDVNTNDTDIIKYIINLLRVNTMVVT